MSNIRNFVIIAHIDHGKSTLADRFLELTGTVEARSMRPQYLDQLDLERERGITIKMAPVRMEYAIGNEEYILNLIDTPGHSDFSYEVSRALEAVEGAILLVDATKGIQAQTLSNLRMARKARLAIIGAVNKIDLEPPHLARTIEATATLLGVPASDVFRISGKTGEGVPELLRACALQMPPPRKIGKTGAPASALIFDSLYDDHKGILAFVRAVEGSFRAGDEAVLYATGERIRIKEAGYFAPKFKIAAALGEGEIGYIATGVKEPALVTIGDTILRADAEAGAHAPYAALPGYAVSPPVVFISFYPDGQTKFEDLRDALARLHLNDAALSFEPDANEALGRGFKVGFLGQLHFEITVSRLTREFHLSFLTSFPSIAYRVEERGASRLVAQAHEFPVKPDRVFQPMIHVEILTPSAYLANIMNLKTIFDLRIGEVQNLGDNLLVLGKMPLAELIRDFDDRIKSASAGFASFSYERAGEEEADVEKLEVLVAGEPVPALTRIVPRKDIEREGRQSVERLKELLPKKQFAQALQARAGSRIVARETIAPMRKDVTGYLYGGDRSRKMKLWKKQKRGKERLKASGKVAISAEVFREILKK